MDDLYVPEPQRYTGVMAWKTNKLRANIMKVKPDYNEKDVRTWPLINDVHTIWCPRPSDQRWVPKNMAYSLSYVDSQVLGAERPFDSDIQMSSDVIGPMINYRFRYWPFNFTPQGDIRNRVGIPRAEFEEWMRAVNGPFWKTAEATKTIQHSNSAPQKKTRQAKRVTLKVGSEKLSALANASRPKPINPEQLSKLSLAVSPKTVAVVVKPRSSTQTMSAVQPTQPAQPVQAMSKVTDTPPTSTYDRILEALAEQQTATTSTVELEQKLADSERQRQQNRDRADEAEQQLVDSESQCQQEKDRADEAALEIMVLKAVHEKQKSQHHTALQKIQGELTRQEHISQTRLEQTIAAEQREEVLKKELETIRRKAAEQKTETDERFERIWAEMQKLKGSGGQKRKTDGESAGGQDKKAKF